MADGCVARDDAGVVDDARGAWTGDGGGEGGASGRPRARARLLRASRFGVFVFVFVFVFFVVVRGCVDENDGEIGEIAISDLTEIGVHLWERSRRG